MHKIISFQPTFTYPVLPSLVSITTATDLMVFCHINRSGIGMSIPAVSAHILERFSIPLVAITYNWNHH